MLTNANEQVTLTLQTNTVWWLVFTCFSHLLMKKLPKVHRKLKKV